MSATPSRRGLTLVEPVTLVGLAVLALAVSLPMLRAAQLFGRRMRTENNLKLIALAISNYESVNATYPLGKVSGKGHGVGNGAFVAILPYMEETPAYNAYNFDWEPWSDPNATVVRLRINSYLAAENAARDPIDPDDVPALAKLDRVAMPVPFGPTHFGVNWGGGHEATGADFAERVGVYKGVMMTVLDEEGKRHGARAITMADVADGTSFTLGVVEKAAPTPWAIGGPGGTEYDVHTGPKYDGDDPGARRVLTGTTTPGGPRAAFLDGSVRTLAPTLDQSVWYALQTRGGGEAIPDGALDPAAKGKR